MRILASRNVRCPYCWHSFRESALVYQCQAACRSSDYFDAKAMVKGNCPHGRIPVRRRHCPECKKPLLREYIDNDGQNIAIIGTPGAGKSTYVGVMLHELRGRVSSRFNGLALDLLGDESQRIYQKKYEEPLFHKGMAVDKTVRVTEEDLEPLIFTLKFPGRGASVKSALSVFYDTSGENVVKADVMDPLARYLESAAGIILLIDPSQLPKRSMSNPGLSATAHDQISVVRRLAELLRETQRRSSQRIETPLAVTLTKIDDFQQEFDEDSPLRRPGGHDGHYSEQDGLDVHEEVRAWLDRWAGPELDAALTVNFRNYRYFGVTALGAPPVTATKLSPRGIHPVRVEDPMLWLLARFAAIRTVKRGT